MPFGYPIVLELSGRHVVVIGETAVRDGKVEGLLAADAGSVLVVVERVAERLASLAALDPRVVIARRSWREDDLDDAFVCVASSHDPGVRDSIARAARTRGVLVNVMDDIPNCDWAAPAIVRRGELVLAISTGGGSPALSKKLRLQLSATYGEEWAEVLAVLREVRASTLPFLPDIGDRAARWAIALDTAEAVALVREGRSAELRERLTRRLLADTTTPDPEGVVYLVGAGPGDPKLITVRGAETLARADVVVYDRLASPALLDLVPPHAERIYVGKEPGRSAIPQVEIDNLLVERALRGETVVRLKGGDPFVFGRGGEEVAACRQAGVAFEVVPGITSAIAAPALAGIPVTHRGVAHEFTVVSGHVPPDHESSLVDWDAVAALRGTVVLLMAVQNVAAIAERLVHAGRKAATPVAVVAEGTMPGERTVLSTLGEVAADVAREGVRPPAVVVIGDVVAVANPDRYAWRG